MASRVRWGGEPASPSLPRHLGGGLAPILPDFQDGAPDFPRHLESLGVALEDVLLDGGQADAAQRVLTNHAHQVAGGCVEVHQEASAPRGVEALAQGGGGLLASGSSPPARSPNCPTVFGAAVGGAAERARGREGVLAWLQATGSVPGVKPQQRDRAVTVWGERKAGGHRPVSPRLTTLGLATVQSYNSRWKKSSDSRAFLALATVAASLLVR